VGKLSLLRGAQHRFYIDHRRPVDRFNRAYAQTILHDPSNGDRMQSDRVRAIRGSSNEYPEESVLRVRSRMDFHGLSPRLMQPGEDDDFVTSLQPIKTFGKPGIHLQPYIRCSLQTLLWRLSARFRN
jgi:hypothetical protein